MSQPTTKQAPEADAVANRASRRRAARESALNKGPGEEIKRELYHCNYCQKDISNTPRIKCAVCTDFDLCLECFSVGVEIIPHRNTHDYRVVDNLSNPIYDPEWGADEEVLLLEAIDNFGLGNWQAVADQVGPTKSALQCKNHYFGVYLDVASCPLPTPTPIMMMHAAHYEQLQQLQQLEQQQLQQQQEKEEKERQLALQQQQQQEAAQAAAAAMQAQEGRPAVSMDGLVSGGGEAATSTGTAGAAGTATTSTGGGGGGGGTRKGRKAGAQQGPTTAVDAVPGGGGGGGDAGEGVTSAGGGASASEGGAGPSSKPGGGRTTRQKVKQATSSAADKPDAVVVDKPEAEAATGGAPDGDVIKSEADAKQEGGAGAGADTAMVVDATVAAAAPPAGEAVVAEQGVKEEAVGGDVADTSAPRDQDAAETAAGEGAGKPGEGGAAVAGGDGAGAGGQGVGEGVSQAAGEGGTVHLTGEQQATARSQKRLHRSHTAEEASLPHPTAAHVKSGGLTLHHDHPVTADKAPPKAEPGQEQQQPAPTAATLPPAAAAGAAPPLAPPAAAGAAGGGFVAPSPVVAVSAVGGAVKTGGAGQKLGGTPAAPAGPAPLDPKVQGDYAMGYHARRNEFDPEYDNDAECIIADMEFTECDTEEDRQLKLRILEIYNTRLDAREARRAFLRDYGLLSMRKVQALERRRGAAERDTHARLRVFARYSTPAAHDELVEGLLLEQRLRARIQELKGYRKLGIRTLEEAEIYDSELRKKQKQQGGPSSGADATPAAPTTGSLVWDLATGLTPGLTPPSASQTALAAAAKDSGAASSATAPPIGGNKGAASSLHQWRTHRGVQLDITCLPGTQMLTEREREACAALRLMPSHYLGLKDMMLRDNDKHGSIARTEARNYFRLDAQRCLKLYDLWVSCGWVNKDKAAALKDSAQAQAGIDVVMVDVKPDQEVPPGGQPPVPMDTT